MDDENSVVASERFPGVALTGYAARQLMAEFPQEEWHNALDVAYLESSLNAWAVNDSLVRQARGGGPPPPVNGIPSSPELSVGLWQVNILVHYYPEWPTLFDAGVNAWAAAKVWRAQGWAAWYHSASALGLA